MSIGNIDYTKGCDIEVYRMQTGGQEDHREDVLVVQVGIIVR